MKNKIKIITNRIEKEFINYFIKDEDIETIFVVESMIQKDGVAKCNNNFNIQVITNNINKEKMSNFEKFLKVLSKQLATENIKISYLNSAGFVNDIKLNNKQQILISTSFFQKDRINKLPIMLKYQYGEKYKIVYGTDNLKKFRNIRYSLDELITTYEGLNYFINILKNKEYYYLKWDVENDKSELKYCINQIKDEKKLELCFYIVNNFVNKLINYCKFQELNIPDNRIIFCIRLLGQDYVNEATLFLLQALLSESEILLKTLFDNPVIETINLLYIFKLRINNLEEIFSKNKENKTKKK